MNDNAFNLPLFFSENSPVTVCFSGIGKVHYLL